MKPTLALAKIIWRHSVVGWVSLAFISLLLWLPVGGIVNRHVGAGRPPMVWRYEFALGWSFVGACLIALASTLAGAAIDRLRSRTGLHVVPGMDRHLHRMLWLAFALFWLLAGAPGALLAGPDGAWWALPWSLGAAAGAMSMGVWGVALGARARWFGLVLFLIWSGNALWRPMAVDAMSAVAVEPATLRGAAASAGLLLFALWVWTARHIASRATTSGGAASDWQQFLFDTQMRLLTPAQELLAGRDLRWLVMPQRPPTMRQEAGLLALNAAVLFVMSRWFAQPATSLAASGLATALPYFIFLAAWSAAPHMNGVWVSPRVLLLPQGGQRKGMALRLFQQALTRTVPRAALHASVAAAALCLAGGLGAADAAIRVLAALASLPFAAAAALAVAPWVRGQGARTFWAFTANVGFVVLLVLAGHFGCGLPFDIAPPWWWALLSLALSVSLAAVLMALVARPWARLDWARMPASPMRMIR